MIVIVYCFYCIASVLTKKIFVYLFIQLTDKAFAYIFSSLLKFIVISFSL